MKHKDQYWRHMFEFIGIVLVLVISLAVVVLVVVELGSLLVMIPTVL